MSKDTRSRPDNQDDQYRTSISTPGLSDNNGRARNESIDQNPLKGHERSEFESMLIARSGIDGSVLHLLEVLLAKWHWGRADSYVSNAAIAARMKVDPRHVRRLLEKLRDDDHIIMVQDRSIPTQRRIILTDHPNVDVVIKELRKYPSIKLIKRSAPREDKNTYKVSAPREDKKSDENPIVHDTREDISGAPREDIFDAPRGDIAVSSESVFSEPLPVKKLELEFNSREGEKNSLGTGTGRPLAPLAQEDTAMVLVNIDYRMLSPEQVQRLALFSEDERRQIDRAPAEIRSEILISLKRSLFSDSTRDMIRIKLANIPKLESIPSHEIRASAAPAGVDFNTTVFSTDYAIQLLEQLCPGAPDSVCRMAEAALCQVLGGTDNRDYTNAYHQAVEQVRRGLRAPAEVVHAFRQAIDPSANNPGKVFAYNLNLRRTGR